MQAFGSKRDFGSSCDVGLLSVRWPSPPSANLIGFRLEWTGNLFSLSSFLLVFFFPISPFSFTFFALNSCQALFASVIRSQGALSRLHYENSKRSSGLLIKHYTLLQYCMEMYRTPAALSGGFLYKLPAARWAITTLWLDNHKAYMMKTKT